VHFVPSPADFGDPRILFDAPPAPIQNIVSFIVDMGSRTLFKLEFFDSCLFSWSWFSNLVHLSFVEQP